MKTQFSTKSLFAITALVAAFAAFVGMIYRSLGGMVLGAFLLYFCVFFLVAVLIYGKKMLSQYKGFWSLWNEANFVQSKPDETGGEASLKMTKHPLD
jgi:hypothetical protein